MKRVLLAVSVLSLCLLAGGCTLYFLGSASVSGAVYELSGSDRVAIPGVQVTITSASDPKYTADCPTSLEGLWFSPPLRRDKYTVQFSKENYGKVQITVELRQKGANVVAPDVYLAKLDTGGGGK
ncbi:MAG: hypothetical protein VB144_11950 [Clostridia bacterium]|nr:hypothetical protein [Clostridia bacterium]